MLKKEYYRVFASAANGRVSKGSTALALGVGDPSKAGGAIANQLPLVYFEYATPTDPTRATAH